MKKFKSKFFISKKAFSLIELSIVILIIGILVAGVTQSSRLVKQFLLTSARNVTLSSPVGTIKDLALWLDAVNEKAFDIQISEGSNIAYWQDTNPMSTSQLRLIQNTPSDQPTYTFNGISGLPSVRYNSAINNSRLVGTNMALSRESTIFLVLRWDFLNTANNQSCLIEISGDSAWALLESYIYNNSLLQFNYYPYAAINGNNGYNATLNKNTNTILRRVYNPKINYSAVFLNGTLGQSGIASYSGNYDSSGNATIYLGNHPGNSRTYGGLFGELIIYNRVLSNDEIIDIERYLSRKWAIKLSY